MLDTMKKLDETGQRILFIAPEGKLKAVVTDGDIRKCILRGGALSAPLTQAANYHPHSLPVAERGRARAELQRLERRLTANPAATSADTLQQARQRLANAEQQLHDYQQP